ncbi:MAG: hypothetical protein QOI51_1290, partial [Nocardioidaceae bacterium]|nr:hypothetical protein [Nocardioidaceae bacterium]
STPWGLARMGQLTAFYATLVSIEPWLDDQALVFVPLTTWEQTPELAQDLVPGLERIEPEVSRILSNALNVLRKSDHALRAHATIAGRTVSTTQIVEGLAMLQQELCVDGVFGAKAAADLRASIRASGGDGVYYTAVDVVEDRFGPDRESLIAVLEAALHVNYGVYSTTTPLTPAELLAELVAMPEPTDDTPLSERIDATVFRFQGFNRRDAFDMTYEVSAKTLDQVAAAAVQTPDGGSAKHVRTVLASAVRAAFTWSAAARHRHDLGDDILLDAVPQPAPYSLPAPVVIEGYPGRMTLKSQFANSHITRLAGAEGPGRAFLKAYGDAVADPALMDTDETFVSSVLWTPTPDTGETAIPYLELLGVVRELMYWRGITFGPGAISPITYFSTTVAEAEARGQQLVGQTNGGR